jgi:hypothetical protein
MEETLLQKIGKKYNTDKASHLYRGISYLDIYDRHFSRIRNNVKKFVEIGVLNGHSLLMWREYFPNAEIVGIDINPECKNYESDRIKIIIGDQNNDLFLKELSENLGPIDILLDDGSHITSHQVKSFNYLYPSITKEGFYLIEDLRNSYEEVLNHHDLRKIWPGMIYNDKDDELRNYRKEFNDFVNGMVKNLDFHTEEKILGIYHYPMILMIENNF